MCGSMNSVGNSSPAMMIIPVGGGSGGSNFGSNNNSGLGVSGDLSRGISTGSSLDINS